MERGAVAAIGTGGQAGGLETVRAARAAVEEVAALAVSPTPEVLDRTVLLLQSAIACLTAVRDRSGSAPDGARQVRELKQIRRAIHTAGALLRKAQQYHAGWSAYLGARTGGYRAGGQPVLLPRPSRFRAEG
jgi:hypothetical protein